MGMHDTRRCACNKVFQLPSLMSRQAQCYDCLRAEAVAVMEARKGETAPTVNAKFLRSGIFVPPQAPDRDVRATGTAKPVLVDVDKLRGDLKRLKWDAVRDLPAETPPLNPFVSPALREAYADYQRTLARGKPKVDVTRDPLPPVPRTHDEAVALLAAGWWMALGGEDGRPCYQYRAPMQYRANIASAKTSDPHWGRWKDLGGELSQLSLDNGDFHPIRPESA